MALRRWLQPPEFPDPDVSLRAVTLWRVGRTFLVFGVLSLALAAALLDWSLVLPIAAPVVLIWIGVLALTRVGRLGAAAQLLVWGLWVIQVASVCITGGILSPTLLTFVVVILAAGLLVNERTALFVGIMSSAAVVAMWGLDAAGVVLPNVLANHRWFLIPILISVFAGAYIVIVSARRQIIEAQKLSRRYEGELRQAQKMEAVGRLAGGVAHDFNNLLTAILGFGDLLRMRTKGDPTAEEAATQICAAAESATELTTQLLAFSRRPAHRSGPVDLNRTIRSIEPMLSRLLGEDVAIVLRLHEPLPPVEGQTSLLEQTVVNLAVNARDAMPGGGTLHIETATVADGPGVHTDPSSVVLRITDDGLGMTEEVRSRAFDPFFTTKSESGGTGLGLSSVYGAVAQCGGTAHILSPPGGGTCFEIVLRAAEPSSEANGTILEPEIPPSVEPRRVLIAEDDARVRSLIVTVLEDAGHEVLEASSAEAALDLAHRTDQPIDLLVSDVVMTGLDGVSLSQRLEAEDPSIRVLLISGHAARPGATGQDLPESAAFLQKPFTPAQLHSKIAEILVAPTAQPRTTQPRTTHA